MTQSRRVEEQKSLTTRYNLKRQDWKKTTSLEEMPPGGES